MVVTRGALLPALMLLLAACSTTQSIRPRESEPAGFAPWSDLPPVYRLGAGDRIKVDYLLTPEMAEEAVIGPDGYIGLRAAGRVPAQNHSIPELQALIEQASRRMLRNPIVTASVVEARSARVIVGGAVRTPGVYPLPSRASTLEMVVQAGGFQAESRMNQVVVIRPRPGERAMLRTVDLRRFISTGDQADSIALAPGDIIFVPRSRIAEVNLWIEENINRLLPFTRSFNYNIGRTVGNLGQ
ncbi:sugar ABC transporter substrate-binding protein [Sphingomonas oleivorans]|uniref:Sugar ABC transporter substrate-binding protein n=1 Tax=Sphingomonas oleivorans TaxID=1735121 RepID=A0A2T5FW22_9SPHN|nr:polysaccharide biosynthesis/export family protein [Sphingomonas oleivorans]PTQ09977.1 sugar ABC transporter substrate-binding protein [Sphingomonas oleivorans]